MVEYSDGSVIAQICATDMRMPIQYALTWPERAEAPVPRLDWVETAAVGVFPAGLVEVSAASSRVSGAELR